MSDSETPSTPATPHPEESSPPATPSTPGVPETTPAASDATPSTPGGSENGEVKRGPSLLQQQFRAFARFGDSKSDGTAITLSQSDKWMKQAKVIDGRTVTTTDTGIAFKKFKQQKIHFKEFQKLLDELAASKKVEPKKLKQKLANCGAPGTRSNASPGGQRTSVYDRLCDVNKYGASHRQRFDEHGKGRGIAGRKEDDSNAGYVTGYKNQDTYPKKR